MKVKIKAYTVIERAVEEGVEYGIARAHKHTDKPQLAQIKHEVETAVMNELSEVIDWEE